MRYVYTASEIIAIARPGDRVTISTPQGGRVSGRVVFARPDGSPHLTLNCGGRYGTPAVANVANILSMRRAS